MVTAPVYPKGCGDIGQQGSQTWLWVLCTEVGTVGSRVPRPGCGSFVQRWGSGWEGLAGLAVGPLCGGGQSMAGLAGLGVRFHQLY